MEMRLANFREAQRDIRHGDLLLYRRRGLISLYGRGLYSHAATATWQREHADGVFVPILHCLELREFVGFQAKTLQSQVALYPGRIDVYRPNARGNFPDYDPHGVVVEMWKKSRTKYNYRGVLRAGAGHVPILRELLGVDTTQSHGAPEPEEHCSQARASADRIGGHVRPVSGLPDHLVEPNDLARSLLYAHGYRFTLVP